MSGRRETRGYGAGESGDSGRGRQRDGAPSTRPEAPGLAPTANPQALSERAPAPEASRVEGCPSLTSPCPSGARGVISYVGGSGS